MVEKKIVKTKQKQQQKKPVTRSAILLNGRLACTMYIYLFFANMKIVHRLFLFLFVLYFVWFCFILIFLCFILFALCVCVSVHVSDFFNIERFILIIKCKQMIFFHSERQKKSINYVHFICCMKMCTLFSI